MEDASKSKHLAAIDNRHHNKELGAISNWGKYYLRQSYPMSCLVRSTLGCLTGNHNHHREKSHFSGLEFCFYNYEFSGSKIYDL